MASYDLTNRMSPYLDRHLKLRLLDFLQKRQLYAEDEMLKEKIELASTANMVDFIVDAHNSLYHTEDVPQDMVDRMVEVVARFKSLKESAAPLTRFLGTATLVQELRPDIQYNRQLLNDRFQVGPEQIEALYQFAKFQFECGFYSDAADCLYLYRALGTNPERSLSASWGKLAAEILMNNWDIALEELNCLKAIIDSRNFASPLTQLQDRIWLLHWSLFIFFNHGSGINNIINLFLNDRYLNAIQTNAPHLLRYVAIAVVVNKSRKNMLKELTKVIQQERHAYRDPITEFLEALYVDYDFDGAQKKLHECEDVILNDPFLGKCVIQVNSGADCIDYTVALRDVFLENARLFFFETYCQIHQCIDIRILAEKLNMAYDEAERWIETLLQSAELDAKIDFKSRTIVKGSNQVNVYEQIIEKTKQLSCRTYLLAKNVIETTAGAC